MLIFLRASIFLSMLCFAVVGGAHISRHPGTGWTALAFALFLAVAFGGTFYESRNKP